MARILTAGAAAEIAKKLGTEPIFIIEIDWPPLRTYADKDFLGAEGKIIALGELESTIKVDSRGASASIRVTLDDTDGSIKALMNTQDLHKRIARVFQNYEGLVDSDKFLLFQGEVSSPLVWSEVDRTVSFNIVQEVESKEIGFSPEEGEFDFIADEAIGKAWPLVFGSPIRVPAVKITEKVRGTSLTRYGAISIGNLDDLCARAQSVAIAELNKRAADSNAGFSDANYADVIDGLTSATVGLNLAFEGLITDSPNQESDLRDYIEACKQITLNGIDFVNFSNDVATAEATIDELEGTAAIPPGAPGNETGTEEIPETPGTIATLQAQLLQQQTALDALQQQAPSAERDAAIAVLVDSINLTNANLQQANIDLNGASEDLRIATQQRLLASLNVGNFTKQKNDLELKLTKITLTQIIVDGGDDFPQGVTVKIITQGMKFSGIFTGEIFNIETANIPFFFGVQSGPRANQNTNEYFLADASFDLQGKFCYFLGKGVVFVDSQDGTRCFFSPLLYKQTGELPLLVAQTRDLFSPEVITAPINEATVYIDTAWINALRATGIPEFASGLTQFAARDWSLEVGDEIYLDGNYTEIYIANLIPSTVVHEVMAFRTVDGIRTLLPVPAQRLTINLNEAIAGQQATTIRLLKPLTEYVGEGWETQIFVTLTSSEGPNTADVIEYLATNYTDLGIDASSFAALNASLALYPSHFAILDRPDALETIESIAWQARSAAFVKNKVLFVKYLSAEDAAIITLSETEAEFGSFTLQFSPTEDLVTKFIGQWTRDYSDEEEENEIILRNNIGKYGTIEETYDFFIYNIESLVVKSLTFWLFRFSNTWKIVKLQGFLNSLELELFDTVEMSFLNEFIGTGALKGVVEKASYDSVGQVINYEVKMSVRIGELDQYVFFWPATAPPGTIYPTLTDLFTGGGNC